MDGYLLEQGHFAFSFLVISKVLHIGAYLFLHTTRNASLRDLQEFNNKTEVTESQMGFSKFLLDYQVQVASMILTMQSCCIGRSAEMANPLKIHPREGKFNVSPLVGIVRHRTQRNTL